MNKRFINNLHRAIPFCSVKIRCLMYLLPLLLALGSSNKSSAAFILGRDPVCHNDTANYYIASPTPGVTYLWVVNSYGLTSGSTTSVINVLWIAPGTGRINAYGIDSTGDTVETAVRNVRILKPPVPYITSSYRVACQELAGDGGAQPRPPGIYDTSKCQLVCSGASVTYYGHKTGGGTLSWSASGASSIFPMGDSCIVIWGSPGKGTLTLSENVAGCIGYITYCFDIIEKPLAHFQTRAILTDNTNSTSNSINICREDNVIFIDLSTASAISPIMSCYWDFGDGKFTTTASPTSVLHQYKSPGTYTAMLVVKNACGCSDTARVEVNVSPEVGVDITCPSVVCEGSIAGYRVHNYGSCPMFNWQVIGGTILPTPGPMTDTITVRWDNVDTSGFGYVMFDAGPCTSLCNGSAIVKIPIIQNRGKIRGPKVICKGEPAMYRMPMWPTTKYFWNTASITTTLDTTDQWNEVVVTASAPGTVVLRVNYRNTLLGCGGVAYDTITVLDKLTILEKGKLCEGTVYTWSLSNPGSLGDWTLVRPGGSTSTLPSSNSLSTILIPGSYKLYVSGAFCAMDTIRFDVTPKAPAVDSLLGPDRVCPGIPTKYEAKNILSGYNFGWAADPGTLAPPDKNITYAKFSGAGPWEIKVWRTDMITGCPSDTLRKSVLSPIVPVHITGEDSVCGSSLHSYSVDYLEGETYTWYIYDHTWSPKHSYIGSVTAPVDSTTIGVTWQNPRAMSELAHLVVEVRKCGILMLDTLDVLVDTIVTPTILGPDTVCSGALANFTSTFSPALYSLDAYAWAYDDATASTGSVSSTSHVWNTRGTNYTYRFTVTLDVENPNGCNVNVRGKKSVVVLPEPVGEIKDKFGNTFGHCGLSTWTNTLELDILTTFGSIVSYQWYKEGTGTVGTPSTDLLVTNSILGPGIYYAIILNSNGCYGKTDAVTIDTACIHGPCDPTFRPTITMSGGLDGCAHATIHGNWSPLGWGFKPKWYWPYDVAQTHTDNTLTASFLYAGLFKFYYEVSYLSGTDTCVTLDSIKVKVPYKAKIAGEWQCVPGGYRLFVQNRTSYYLAFATNYYYLNGAYIGSTTTQGDTFSFGTLSPGVSYTIMVKVKGPGSDTCTATWSETVPPLPTASFTVTKYNPACVSEGIVEFVNTSPTGYKAVWDFGDTSTSNLWSPWKWYGGAAPTKKYVTLKIYNEYGCGSIFKDTIDIVPNTLAGYVDASSSIGCSGSPITLTYTKNAFPLTLTMPTSYKWYEQTRLLDSNTSSTRMVTEPGGYWVFGYNNSGCKVRTAVTVVDFNYVPRAIITGDTSVCEGESYTIRYPAGAYDTAARYTWYENGAPIYTFKDPSLTMSNTAGTYNYRLVISITSGGVTCYDTSELFTVIVHPYPGFPTVSYTVLDCDEYKVQLSATSTSYGTFNWSSGDVGNPVYVYTGGPYRVWITDTFGCSIHNDIIVPKKPDVYQYVFPVGCYSLCLSELPLTLLGPKHPASFTRWDWLKNGITASGGSGYVPSYNVTTAGTYNLALANTPCADTSGDMNIAVKNCPNGCAGSLQFVGAFKTMAGGGMCYDTVQLGVACAPGTTWIIYGDNGTLLPGTGTGAGTFKFRYIADRGFAGPMDNITIIFTNPMTGMTCRFELPIPIMPCPNSMARTTDGKDIDSGKLVVNDYAHLLLSPNPAQNTVRVDYGFNGKADQRSVEIFDMAGRRILSEQLTQDSGSVQFNLDNLSSGLYQVILRQDGQVFLHSKLSVTK